MKSRSEAWRGKGVHEQTQVPNPGPDTTSHHSCAPDASATRAPLRVWDHGQPREGGQAPDGGRIKGVLRAESVLGLICVSLSSRSSPPAGSRTGRKDSASVGSPRAAHLDPGAVTFLLQTRFLQAAPQARRCGGRPVFHQVP